MRDHPPGFCIAHPGYRLKASPTRRAQQAIAQVNQRLGAGSSCIEGGMPRDDANQISAALPLLAPRNLTTIGILGTGSNSEVHYRNYFSMIPLGPDPQARVLARVFRSRRGTEPEAADGGVGRSRCRVRQEQHRRSTRQRDLAPVARAVKAANPDIVFVAAYPPDTVGFVRAASEAGLVPKIMGGTMIGLLATPLKMQLGPLMNGYLNNAEVFVPIATFDFPGVKDVLEKYREQAKGQGVDPFGCNFAPYGYAAGQVLAQAVEGSASFDHTKIADYLRSHALHIVVGEIAFGKDGEWTKPRMVLTQWQGIAGNELSEITDLKKWVVVWPLEHKTGTLIYPFAAARK
jgi:branched-chain amino acid transport system substrate-binding protein